MYGQKKKFSTFSYKLVQISPIMILVNSGAFLSISSWFCELTELICVMIPYISSTGYPPTTERIICHVQVANSESDIRNLEFGIWNQDSGISKSIQLKLRNDLLQFNGIFTKETKEKKKQVKMTLNFSSFWNKNFRPMKNTWNPV